MAIVGRAPSNLEGRRRINPKRVSSLINERITCFRTGYILGKYKKNMGIFNGICHEGGSRVPLTFFQNVFFYQKTFGIIL